MDELFDLPPTEAQPEPPAGRGKPRLQRPNRGQVMLRPSDLESLLPADHRAREVWAFVEGLDLAAFHEQIRAVEGHGGRPPIDPAILTARFGEYGLWSSYHTGLDFNGNDGDPIKAIANGVVTSVGYDGAYGNKTVVTLEDGTEIVKGALGDIRRVVHGPQWKQEDYRDLLSLMYLIPEPPGLITDGEIWFGETNLLARSEGEVRVRTVRKNQLKVKRRDSLLKRHRARMNKIRGREMSMIFQEPMTSLNPLHVVEKQICETLFVHKGLRREQARARAIELLKLVGLPDAEARLASYPHQLSGGQRQRVMIAMALANEPDLLIADEPTTALDVSVQAQILNLLKDLQATLGLTYIFVSHNLAVVDYIADTIAVMSAGIIEQMGAPDELYENPRTTFVANFLGQSNLIEGAIQTRGEVTTCDMHGITVSVPKARRWPATDEAMHRRELVSTLAEPRKPFISLLAT